VHGGIRRHCTVGKGDTPPVARHNTNTAFQLDPDLVQAGILALLVATREDGSRPDAKERPRTEVVLSDVGFPIAAIARLVGRPYETVKSTLRRSRSSGVLVRAEGIDEPA
jgi:hypothetical protein